MSNEVTPHAQRTAGDDAAAAVVLLALMTMASGRDVSAEKIGARFAQGAA